MDYAEKVSPTRRSSDLTVTGEIGYVDSLKLLTPHTSFTGRTMTQEDSLDVLSKIVNGGSGSEVVKSRTFLNADGDAVVSVSMDDAEKVTGISRLYKDTL